MLADLKTIELRMERMETDRANGQVLEKPFDDETLAGEGGNEPDYKSSPLCSRHKGKKAEIEQ